MNREAARLAGYIKAQGMADEEMAGKRASGRLGGMTKESVWLLGTWYGVNQACEVANEALQKAESVYDDVVDLAMRVVRVSTDWALGQGDDYGLIVSRVSQS